MKKIIDTRFPCSDEQGKAPIKSNLRFRSKVLNVTVMNVPIVASKPKHRKGLMYGYGDCRCRECGVYFDPDGGGSSVHMLCWMCREDYEMSI